MHRTSDFVMDPGSGWGEGERAETLTPTSPAGGGRASGFDQYTNFERPTLDPAVLVARHGQTGFFSFSVPAAFARRRYAANSLVSRSGPCR
jgi:hypothetical protein